MTKTMILGFILAPLLSIGQVHTGSLNLADSITLGWSIKDFVKKEHKLGYCTEGETRYLCKIDNQEWFGSDNSEAPPENQLIKLILKIGTRSYNLETTKMFNPNYGSQLSKNQFKIKKINGYYRLYGFFSDGGGTYTAHWKIFNGRATRELISVKEEDFSWQFED